MFVVSLVMAPSYLGVGASDKPGAVQSQDLGYPRQYEHPTVASAINDILAICQQYNIPCGHPHVDAKNVDALVAQGYRWLMTAPETSFNALAMGRKAAGRLG